ncbi:hypothetical protein JK635_07425 [Neobacillus sp. YIM B02564]|uniref:Uncharacterized protein n=1 Tax=Neobacillus paridis TaxID=2803862 RepID=A0ABS1TLZ9_9BACI|nr:hypothetical protein [Neobacillus paridis]MBL4952039.1 hypothetical protein [Neobacillus paridis]
MTKEAKTWLTSMRAFPLYQFFLEGIEAHWEYKRPLTMDELQLRNSRLYYIVKESCSILSLSINEKKRAENYQSPPKEINTLLEDLLVLPDTLDFSLPHLPFEKIQQSETFLDTLHAMDLDLFCLLREVPLDLADQLNARMQRRRAFLLNYEVPSE